jgi:hypothetical protein
VQSAVKTCSSHYREDEHSIGHLQFRILLQMNEPQIFHIICFLDVKYQTEHVYTLAWKTLWWAELENGQPTASSKCSF